MRSRPVRAGHPLLAKERGGPKIDFQVLFYPMTDADFDTPSYREFASGYLRTPKAMEWFWDHYLPDSCLQANGVRLISASFT